MRGNPTLLGAAHWHTPRAGAEHFGQPRENDRAELQAQAAMWATPGAGSENSQRGSAQDPEIRGHQVNLQDQACYWGTPRVSDSPMHGAEKENDRSRIEDQAYRFSRQVQATRDGNASSENGQTSPRLNPRFVEWLQGLPNGYSDPNASMSFGVWETWLARCKQQLRLLRCGNGSR